MQYQVTCENLYLRRGPTKKSGVLKLLKKGDIVTGGEVTGDGWMPAEFQGVQGYLQAKYVELTEGDYRYDEDSIGPALEKAIESVYTALDELKALIRQL